MNKILALYINEMTKVSRRISVWILLLCMALTTFLGPRFFLRVADIERFYEETAISAVTKPDITKMRDSAREELGDPNQYVDHSTIRFTIQNEVFELFATYLNIDESDLSKYSTISCANSILINYNFDAYPIESTFLSTSAYIGYIITFRDVCYLNSVPFDQRDNVWFQNYSRECDRLDYVRTALFSHDYESYIKYLEMDGIANGRFTETEAVRILSEIDPQGTFDSSESSNLLELISDYLRYKQLLSMNVDLGDSADSYIPLTAARRAQLENSVKILEKQFADHTYPSRATTISASAISFGMNTAQFFLVLLVIILAGSSISSEMATGSIKSLIIAPVKRWKIFLAKLLAIITWIFSGSLVITLGASLSMGLKSGFSTLAPYYFVSGGQVRTIPYVLFALLLFLASNIPLLVYVLVAYAISCNTKNTGVAVGISTGLVLSNTVTQVIIEAFSSSRWIDFLPMANMYLTDKIFPYLRFNGFNSDVGGTISFQMPHSIPLSFSVTYLAIFSFVLLFIAYDGFVRKDIQ